MDLTFAATLLALLGLSISGLDLALGMRRIAALRAVQPIAGDDVPQLSIVVAARNEERNIAVALRSLLALDYPRLEVVVVDDRSDDRTSAIIREIDASLAAQRERTSNGQADAQTVAGAAEQADASADAPAAAQPPRLRALRIDELPAGWLGKNHALWHGVQHASGDLLLFSDADVVMAPDTLRRAVAYLQQHELDHLALGPEVHMPGVLLRAFSLTGTLFFCFATRPWKARDARSRAHIGIGAFNLLRRSTYERIGGHRAIALRPDDDMKLGKIVKKHGARQDFVHGRGLVSVEWYASTGELVHGLTKNVFAGLDYRLPLVIAATLGQLLLFVWPVVAFVVTRGATQFTALAAVVLTIVLHGAVIRTQRVAAAHACLYPAVSCVFIYVLWRSTLVTLARGGIEWRGTRYPLAALKSNRV